MEDNSNRHFKGQQRDEEVVYYSCKHWIVLVPLMIEFAVAGAIMTTLVSILFVIENKTDWSQWVFVAMTGLAAIWLHSFFTRVLNYFLDIVIITNFRVLKIEKSLYLQDDQNIVDLHEIQDIKKIQHGIISNLFDYGKLVIVTPTMIEPMILEKMPDPERFFRKVNNSKRDYIYARQQRKLKSLNYEYATGQTVNQ